jgi:hypothetical protein
MLFNDGYFPRLPRKLTDVIYTGLLFESKNGKINRITFCSHFIEKRNYTVYYMIECRLICITESGVSMEAALTIYNNDDTNNFLHITRNL